jgi:hypothetical protein
MLSLTEHSHFLKEKTLIFLQVIWGFSVGLICREVLKKEMQKIFPETFTSKN